MFYTFLKFSTSAAFIFEFCDHCLFTFPPSSSSSLLFMSQRLYLARNVNESLSKPSVTSQSKRCCSPTALRQTPADIPPLNHILFKTILVYARLHPRPFSLIKFPPCAGSKEIRLLMCPRTKSLGLIVTGFALTRSFYL